MRNNSKQFKMTAGIRKRGDSYSIAISLGKDPETGRYKYLYETVTGTREDAKKRRAELIHQIANGTFITPSKTTLAEYLETWLKEYVWAELAPRTSQGYDLAVRRHLTPALGRITLTGLKPGHIGHYQSEKLSRGRADSKGGLSPRTVRSHYMVLHAALERAVKMGLVGRNVADAVSPPRCQRHQWQSLSEFGVSSVLEAGQRVAVLPRVLPSALHRAEALRDSRSKVVRRRSVVVPVARYSEPAPVAWRRVSNQGAEVREEPPRGVAPTICRAGFAGTQGRAGQADGRNWKGTQAG